jgi:NADPH:quinone reductase-like Zn-dependent oxidoreductase
MKAIVHRRNGEPSDVLVFEDVADLPAPVANEITVRLTRRMIHPIDGLLIRGIVPAPISSEGAVPGSDGVGVIEAIGADVALSSQLRVGQRVMIFHVHGTWTERVNAPVETVIPVPDDIDDVTACQIVINGITACVLMRAVLDADGNAGTTSPLVVTAAGSGVGRNVIALARMKGFKVIAVARSDSGIAILKAHMPDLIVVSTEHEGWQSQVTQAYGEAPTVIIDPIGGEMTARFLNLLADGGTLLTYGGLDPRSSAVSTIAMTIHRWCIRGVNAPSWLTNASAGQRQSDIAMLFEMARTVPQNFSDFNEFDLSDAKGAMAAAQATPRRGATLLVTNG